ncbi:aspartate carbamoyltransferase [Bifidobacterium longum subsp. longum 35B]|nr:aspartate carbamoyltransferase [Bifidobacterium longum subsp. longum 35B]
MVGKSVVTLDGLSTNQILDLLHKAEYIDSHRKEVAHTCDGRVLATLFYEPSTRTRLSFETAMLRLGGKVIGFAGAQLASVTKGESIADTLKTVSNYVDVVAIRHPKEGAALVASRAASVPVINAGDGGHMHPTQTLADLATLQSRFGRITDLTVGLCGDLTFGRTVHSLIETLCRFGNVRFVLISPDELKTPQYVIDRINATDNCSYVEVRDLASVIGDLDVLYMTRVQRTLFTKTTTCACATPTFSTKRSCSSPSRPWPCFTRCRASTKSPWTWTTTRVPPTSNRSRTACSCAWPSKAPWWATNCPDTNRSTPRRFRPDGSHQHSERHHYRPCAGRNLAEGSRIPENRPGQNQACAHHERRLQALRLQGHHQNRR